MMKKVYDVVIDEETRKKGKVQISLCFFILIKLCADFEASKLPVNVKKLLYQITDLELLRRYTSQNKTKTKKLNMY